MEKSNLVVLDEQELRMVEGGSNIKKLYNAIKAIIDFLDKADGKPQL
ncbi:MAG: hypothetical protein Q4C98_10625 [Capnocytophaga sp.]|nr:hypothetical protein [Capnocytophaga sp.]